MPAILDLLDMAFWTEKGNLGAIYTGKTLNVYARDAFKNFDAGRAEGDRIRSENERKQKSGKSRSV